MGIDDAKPERQTPIRRAGLGCRKRGSADLQKKQRNQDLLQCVIMRAQRKTEVDLTWVDCVVTLEGQDSRTNATLHRTRILS